MSPALLIFVVYLGKKDKIFGLFYHLNCKSEGTLGLSMGHSNLKSESFAYSFFLSLFQKSTIRSTISNILIICIFGEFYFAHDFIIFWLTWNLISFEVCFPTKNSAKIIFAKTMEMQKRMPESKYKHSIYIVLFIQFDSPFFKKELCSDTIKIQQTQQANSTNPFSIA